jgi:hypothetical protein
MRQKVVLLDLENNQPNLELLHEVLKHYDTLYLFNCTGNFEFALDDLTELATLISSGRIMILDVPDAPHKEYEYAVLVGQLMALLPADTHVEIISAMDSSETLLMLLQSSEISASLIQVTPEASKQQFAHHTFKLPSIETIKQKPALLLIKKYAEAIAKTSGKPTNVEGLKNSLMNILKVMPEKAHKLVGMLINLKIVKCYDEQISFRKKLLKQWSELDLNAVEKESVNLSAAISSLKPEQDPAAFAGQTEQSSIQAAQHDLFKNFSQIDSVQLEVARKLRELQADKPKDIYALRDLLEELFPKSDIRMLLKELIEKGYIYWNGHEVLYSHEMYLN